VFEKVGEKSELIRRRLFLEGENDKREESHHSCIRFNQQAREACVRDFAATIGNTRKSSKL
jgi:hypothetical protein